ncbi:methyl-accepting chemotaxis protein [Chitinivorax sp. B]|uniref:methyl-accepting chemotaxis protein n=1 Tax=Chitinivorax sp. B TaxID=2502235 RepID=UPI00148525CA|nr:methyl-accepting chemotaxis protein [Chitinivorax sp. B]
MLVLIALAGLLIVALTALTGLNNTMLQDRQQKTRNLVEVAHDVVVMYQKQEAAGKLPREQAQSMAMAALKQLRYEGTEYFWINDMNAVMLMHPIKPELDGKSMNDAKDPDGKYLFREFVKTVNDKGAGYVDYLWPKPGADRPVAKLSYVKGFAPWAWIIGSGIYIDDVDRAFWRSSSILLLVIAVIVAVMLFVSMRLVRGLVKQLGGEPTYTVDVVKQIANGKLDTEIILQASDSQSLLGQVKQMQAELAQLIRQIRANADEIDSMAKSVADQSRQVANDSSCQSTSASAMAGAVTQMTANIHQISDGAAKANDISRESGNLLRSGSDVIKRATDEMVRISDAVNQTSVTIEALAGKTETISSIMNVIGEVADQTNLLALNAAIEAARAGDHGRGFAVVADEVRKLAERTSAATKEIAQMISDIQNSSSESKANMEEAVRRVEQGVGLANQGRDAVQQIESSTQQVVGLVGEISVALKEQSQATDLVGQQVDRISAAADTNVVASRQAAELTRRMQELTLALHQGVRRFSV